jgi:ligand-binding SRPBCC domain-containing protein
VTHRLVEWPSPESTALAAFRHEHRVAAGEGGTLYTDRVTYSAIGGALTEALLVNAYMRRIFEVWHRNMLRLLR